MSKIRVVKEKLLECHVNYPGYADRGSEHLEVLAKMFVARLSEYSDAEISAAFDAHMGSAKAFPVLADILGYFSTVTAYRLDNGPEGYGAVYAADHPYVRLQTKLGTRLGDYAVEVSAREHAGLRTAAANCVLDFGDDGESPTIERFGSGLRRLSYGK